MQCLYLFPNDQSVRIHPSMHLFVIQLIRLSVLIFYFSVLSVHLFACFSIIHPSIHPPKRSCVHISILSVPRSLSFICPSVSKSVRLFIRLLAHPYSHLCFHQCICLFTHHSIILSIPQLFNHELKLLSSLYVTQHRASDLRVGNLPAAHWTHKCLSWEPQTFAHQHWAQADIVFHVSKLAWFASHCAV